MTERDLDLVVFGATGFTGGLVAEYLAREAPGELRWGIAGRSEDKLRAVRDRLDARPELLVADVADPASMGALAARARVALTTVGPFEERGEPLVRACVEEKTDYLDITGEPRFVDRMIDRYDGRARDAGVKVISCCGFDSIPPDLGVLFTVDQLPPGVPLKIEGFVRSRGTFSGGTWHSAIKAFGEARQTLAERRRRPKERASGGRDVRGLRPRVRYERALDCWVAPLPTIDSQIVLRSARLREDYGPEFRYAHYARIKRLHTVIGGGLTVGAIVALAQLGPTRKLLLKVKDQGEGPSEAQRAKGWFTVTFLAEGGGQRVVTQVSGGDPGYSETAKMLAESGLLLALERDRTPDRQGVITPAAGMGRPLIERLQRAGMAFRVLEGGA